MRSKDCKWLVALAFVVLSVSLNAQNRVSGVITDGDSGAPIQGVEIFDRDTGFITTTNSEGAFQFVAEKEQMIIVFFANSYEIDEQSITVTQDITVNKMMAPLAEEIDEVVIRARRAQVFALKRLKDVEETAIYAGKKNEVVLLDQSMANLASNNARQIYGQVAGLNIYENDDAGLQLNIGGRGLDPNRTANFNTRQNGYDISADVLGYPESYYTTPAEALREIQIIRGAASLQYGTQFGGLINFVIKEPNPNKPFELITRNTVGSFGLYTNFTSISGTKDKFSYYSYFNYKKGDGFRPNSEFESKNAFGYVGYQFNEKTKLSAEVSYLRYLAQQAGGLTDQMFENDPLQSNRTRNWFQVDWLLYNLKLSHKFSEKTNGSLSFFGLNASRYALGFRTNRVDQPDDLTAPRDLIKGNFQNFGLEARLLSEYELFDKKSIFLIGAKYYDANNDAIQGLGSSGIGPDFRQRLDLFPNYQSQSQFDFPNLNVALFGENIFYLNDKLSITPGFRFEYINTKSEGFFKQINLDGAGNVISEETIDDNRVFDRSLLLLGIGASYKPNTALEIYANVSQNYRSVTFSDINITNPSFAIAPNITDEKGFTADLGFRGNFKSIISYDIGAFGLFYNRRIGFVLKGLSDGRVISERGNVGDAVMYGLESLVDLDLNKAFFQSNDISLNYFVNTSVIDSKYTRSEQNGVEGNKVEFVPNFNFKTGLRFGYKNFASNIQYSYLSKQFTDATNSEEANISGVVGAIPAYDVLDVSLSYKYKMFKLETGLNNVLDNSYFTRRATGYPGPGIIPSAPRNWYVTLQVKL